MAYNNIVEFKRIKEIDMEPKPWYTSKTLWVGVLSGLSSAALLGIEFLNGTDYSSGAIVGLVGGIVMVILRLFTNKAVG